jgi:hypothetical protein
VERVKTVFLKRIKARFAQKELERQVVANSNVFSAIVERAQTQFERGETLEPDEFWRKLNDAPLKSRR